MIHIKYVCDNESRKLIVIHYINTIREVMDVIQNIDDYLSRFPEEARVSMQMMRTEIKRIVPDVEETISWGMPSFRKNGILVQFACHKKHIGFYPGPSAIEAFKEDLSAFNISKGTIQFPFDKAIPLDLITRIVLFRVAENNDKILKKKKDKR